MAFALSVGLLFALTAFIYTSFFVTPQYNSFVVIYPSNTHINEHLVSAGLRFGNDKEIGEQVEILNSYDVKDSIIKMFDLAAHYAIDSKGKNSKYDLYQAYDKRISVSRNINRSIHISVLDEDPKWAAKIANAIVEVADKHKSNLIKSNIKTATATAYKNYQYQKNEVLQMELADMADSLSPSVNLANEREKLAGLKTQYDGLYYVLNLDVPKSYIVSHAIEMDKPVYPKKGLTSLLAGAIGFALVLLLFNIKK